MESQGLPIASDNLDKMRNGLFPMNQTFAPPVHPVEAIQRSMFKNQLNMRNFTATNIFGSHMFMKMRMDETILSQFQRLPGLRSEFCGLDTLLNRDEDFTFEDYLSVPEMSETPVDVHDMMERKLGMNVQNLHLKV